MEPQGKNLISSPTDKVTSKSDNTLGISKVFIANFVHQVVNPLNGVIGTLDNVVDGTYSGEDATKKVNACRAQVEQCVTLIRNLAYLSEYFSEEIPSPSLKPVRTNVRSVLPQVLIEAQQFFQVSAKRRHIELNIISSKPRYQIYIRPELLKQVFINIFDNWVKYGIEYSAVEVKYKVNTKDDLVIEIIGQSISFPNSDAERIFELGYRSSSAEGKIAQGSGIGLYICKQIITREVNGKITATHSLSSRLTTFRIAIPSGKWKNESARPL